LEVELPDGSWRKVETEVGAPAGKTKTILVDLADKLPGGVRRLRLAMAFEIHWDSVLLCERLSETSRSISITADETDLRWRGFSEFENLPDFLPLTPDYEKTNPIPPWSRNVSGWCTRYGEITKLAERQDGQLVLINSGDELKLSFNAERLPEKSESLQRDFFLFVVGWDKDADFHVAEGWRVNPLPAKDLAVGSSRRFPEFDETSGARQYHTRWVGPTVPHKRAAAE
jgi:hypothetical protein